MRQQSDLDIWLNPSPENAELMLKSVIEFGFSTYGLSQSDFTKPGNVIQLGFPPLRIDLLTKIDGVTFDECYKNRKEVIIDNLKVNFIGYKDLLKNKKEGNYIRNGRIVIGFICYLVGINNNTMSYREKLEAFILYLRRKEPELEKNLQGLSIDDNGILKCIGCKVSDEEWQKISKYWESFNFNS